MDDLISRQAALTEIRKDGKWLEEQRVTSMTTHERELRDTFILREMPSTQQWIPCSEEEPPFGIEVLITRKGTVRLAEKSVFDKEYPWYIYGHHSFNAKTVDAWMPLPSPYREETES